MRPSLPTRIGDGFAWMVAALLLLRSFTATAACAPASCDAQFACGSRECIGLTCASFFDDAGTECRPAAGVCDVAESCNGHSFACPSDRKLSALAVCRASTGTCDAAEHCDGVSNDCPADVGIVPTIDRVILLDREIRAGPIVLPNHFFHIELDGANLCTATVSAIDLAGKPPSSRLEIDVGSVQPFESGTLGFDVNRGAAAGTLPFVAGAPDGFVEILEPSRFATVGGDPTFSISNGCSNCGVVRADVVDDATLDILAEAPTDFAPPLATPFTLRLEDLVGTPPPLPEAHYVFEAEGIDGTLVADQGFAGDSSGIHFTFLSGTSVQNRIAFSVPEPAALPSALGAVAALAWVGRSRHRR